MNRDLVGNDTDDEFTIIGENMSEENKTSLKLSDYLPKVHVLQHWSGIGVLRYGARTWECDFLLARLLNGRLRIIVSPVNWRQTSNFGRFYPFEFHGTSQDGSQITISELQFTHMLGDSFPREVWLGYAQTASRLQGELPQTVNVRCDLTNYVLYQRADTPHFEIDNFKISLERLGWCDQAALEEHSIAYHHAPIFTCLKIANVPRSEVDAALQCIQNIASLLSLAVRGYVFVAAQHIYNSDIDSTESLYREPPFSVRRWGQPLIPPEAIEAFITSGYPAYEDQFVAWKLAYITDYYLQALTLRSVWPSAVGIFTAMETLNSAFYRRNGENSDAVYWVVPPEEFVSNQEMLDEIVGVLKSHFPDTFGVLKPNIVESLKAQIAHGLKRRSYRTQLVRMLDTLNVEYKRSDLQLFLDVRNDLVHRGTPFPETMALDEIDDRSADVWLHTKLGIALFERALLAFLSYSGPYNLLYETGSIHKHG